MAPSNATIATSAKPPYSNPSDKPESEIGLGEGEAVVKTTDILWELKCTVYHT